MSLILGAVVEVSTGHPVGRCGTSRQIVDGKGSLMSEVRAGDTGRLICVEGIIDAISSVPSLG